MIKLDFSWLTSYTSVGLTFFFSKDIIKRNMNNEELEGKGFIEDQL